SKSPLTAARRAAASQVPSGGTGFGNLAEPPVATSRRAPDAALPATARERHPSVADSVRCGRNRESASLPKPTPTRPTETSSAAQPRDQIARDAVHGDTSSPSVPANQREGVGSLFPS